MMVREAEEARARWSPRYPWGTKRALLGLLMGVGAVMAGWTSAAGALPVEGVTPPVFRTEVPAGGGTQTPLPPAHDPPRRVDGSGRDWRGVPPGFGGVLTHSHGELIYQDHIFDAYGADNGQNTARLAVQDPLTQSLPELYRLDPAYQYLPGEFGIPTGPLVTATNYGMDPMEAEADLSEVRLGTDHQRDLWLLARTTTMNDVHPATALLVLLSTHAGSGPVRAVPFNSGLSTSRADVAVFLHGAYGAWVDLADPRVVHQLPPGSVATDARGYQNAIEARLPVSLLRGSTHGVGVAVAAGLADRQGTGLANLPVPPNVANVAFRSTEPARNWWDKQQALELHQGTIDRFFARADLDGMAAGTNERFVPGPGYHDRIFTSTRNISVERDTDGILQHYGIYLPSSFRAGRLTPTQYWFHFRGGDAHIAATVAPGVLWDMGERAGSIVITPDGRGTDGWYVGRSQADVLQVWADSHRLLPIDRARTYIAGHSMGGWASYLLPIEHPDWFAAAFPASGAVTQGAYTGADLSGCDKYQVQEYSPCFIQANGGDARAEYTGPLLDNLRWVPYAIYQGTNDELVPLPGVNAQVKRLQDLGYRYRYYLFPGQEHYGPPIVDQWTEGTAYEHQFVLDPDPPEVTYVRSMAFEHAIETVNSGGVRLRFPLDHAYWMSGLEPVDPRRGVARFYGRSLALPDPRQTLVPETGAPATASENYPYVMVGQAWREGPASPPSNGFVADLSGARAVQLDVTRMRLNRQARILGRLSENAALILRLRGSWPRGERATVDGRAVPVGRSGALLAIKIPAGRHQLELVPGAGPSRGRRRSPQRTHRKAHRRPAHRVKRRHPPDWP